MRRPHRLRNRTASPVLVVLAGILALPAAADTVRGGAEYLPTDHPSWADVEFLFHRTGLGGLPVFTRPLPRLDLARAVASTLREHPDLAALPPARRLTRELAPELAALGHGPRFPDARETSPPLEWSGDGATFRAQAEIRASATVTDDSGEVSPGTRGALTMRLVLPGGVFALADVGLEKIVDAQPLGDSIVKNSPWYTSSNMTYVAVRPRAMELAGGQLENRWGPGASGTLLISDGALAVPGILFARSFASRVRLVAMTGALHHPSGRWVSAHRAEVRVTDRLSVGLHEAAVYASTGFDPLYLIGMIPYTIVQRLHDRTTSAGDSVSAHRNNVLFGFDAAWRPIDGVCIDGELLIDDLATESSSQPDRIGYLGGMSWSGVALGSSCDFRAEFAKVYRYTYAVFYGADLIHDDVPLGYARGPDVEHALARFDRDVGTDLRVGVGWDWTRRGESPVGEFWTPEAGGSRGSASRLSGVVESRSFPHVRARADWRDVVVLQTRAGVLDVRNRGHDPDDDRVSAHLEIDAFLQW